MNLTIEQYQDAISNSLSSNQIEILKVLYNFPNSTASAKDLAKALNYSNYPAANRQIGQIGKTIANYLKITPETYYVGEIERPAYFLLIGPYHTHEGKERGSKPGWEMKNNLRIALGNIINSSHNNAFLFAWNPNNWVWKDMEKNIEELQEKGTVALRWSCISHKSVKVGDRAFLIRLGSNPKGIMASGFVSSKPFLSPHWGDKDKDVPRVFIEFEVLLNPDKESILALDLLKTGNLSNQHWTTQSSGISIKPECIDELETTWFNFLRNHSNHIYAFNTKSSKPQVFTEGTANQIIQTRYERNPHARKTCLSHYGFSCIVCGFNFEYCYGKIGKEFIHVHHLTQISSISKAYSFDPIELLRPVCPNCHAMIHKQNPPYTIEELKEMIK
jgi:5-methylcytosine-specific restriction protein A